MTLRAYHVDHPQVVPGYRVPVYGGYYVARIVRDGECGDPRIYVHGLAQDGSPSCARKKDVVRAIPALRRYSIVREDTVYGARPVLCFDPRARAAPAPEGIPPLAALLRAGVSHQSAIGERLRIPRPHRLRRPARRPRGYHGHEDSVVSA